jgi:hypothetical protein
MSDVAKFTADQPFLHVANIAAHPGSTFAGVGVGLIGVGQALSNPPVTTAGWIGIVCQIVLGILGALGK